MCEQDLRESRLISAVQSFDRNAMGDGAVFGCDFAGTVEEVGKNVSRVKKGDEIAGLIWGGMCPSASFTLVLFAKYSD